MLLSSRCTPLWLSLLLFVSCLQQTTTAQTTTTTTTELVFNASFDNDGTADGFSFEKDVFRGTFRPKYANGVLLSTGTGGTVLQVLLGGIDNANIRDMSGAWEREFRLPETRRVTLEFDYNLIMAATYESDEYSEVLVGIDGTTLSPIDSLTGSNDDKNVTTSTGWKTVSLDLGLLSEGNHTLSLGGYNNKKTHANEATQVLLDNVIVNSIVDNSVVVSVLKSNFSSSADGFVYANDLFRMTASPKYANGTYNPTGGGSLTVRLGGIDNNFVGGMSGGWTSTFELLQGNAGDVFVMLTYQMVQAADYEPIEFSQVLCSVDGNLVGSSSGVDYVAEIAGNGNGGGDRVVGYATVTLDVGGLAAGSHVIAVGGYNNLKTFQNEVTDIFIDSVEIVVASSSPTPVASVLGSIAGNVMGDEDNDGTGDVNLADVPITLLLGSVVFASTVTDSSGDYVFYNLPLGSYTVTETNIGSFPVDVSDSDGGDDAIAVTIDADSGLNSTGNNFVDMPLGENSTLSPSATPIISNPTLPSSNVFRANFNAGTDGFIYRDDAFRSTNQPLYANGTRSTTNGWLQVELGGVDGKDIRGMSGGWERTFSLPSPTALTLSLRFRLLQAGTEEANERSQALVSVDGTLVGQKPYDVLAQINGDGDRGPVVTTGWKSFAANLGTLSGGTHTIVVGGYSSKKTIANELTTVQFDDVFVLGVDDDDAMEVDATVFPQQAVDRLDLQRFKDNIFTLASFGNRAQGSSSYDNATIWLENELETAGYDVVERANYTFGGEPRNSMYVTKIGTTFPDRMFIVSAHLDGRGSGGAADDNASGCSLVLELAKILANSDIETEISVRFIFWNNGETGNIGSTAYSKGRRHLQGVETPPGSGMYPEPTWLGIIEHNMILFDHGVPPQANQSQTADCDIEFQASSRYAALSSRLAQALFQSNAKYGKLYPAEVTDDMKNTDSVPFRNFAPSCSISENRRRAEIGKGANPNWRQTTDVFASYSEEDFAFGFNIVQTTLGAVAELVSLTVV